MRPGDPIHARAILAAIVRQLEQGANLIQRKAEIPGTANERQPAKFGLAIVAVIRRRAGWPWSQTDPPVLAHRPDLGAGSLDMFPHRPSTSTPPPLPPPPHPTRTA